MDQLSGRIIFEKEKGLNVADVLACIFGGNVYARITERATREFPVRLPARSPYKRKDSEAVTRHNLAALPDKRTLCKLLRQLGERERH